MTNRDEALKAFDEWFKTESGWYSATEEYRLAEWNLAKAAFLAGCEHRSREVRAAMPAYLGSPDGSTSDFGEGHDTALHAVWERLDALDRREEKADG